MEESLFQKLSPDDIILLGCLLGLSLTEQKLTTAEQVVLSSLFSLIGQILSIFAAQRVLLESQQELTVQEQISQLFEQNRLLQKQIDQMKQKI